jgi:hypothetical protein
MPIAPMPSSDKLPGSGVDNVVVHNAVRPAWVNPLRAYFFAPLLRLRIIITPPRPRMPSDAGSGVERYSGAWV